MSLNNQSVTALTLNGWSLPHGCCGTGAPPQTVASGQTAVIRSESRGFATGTEFTVKHRLDLTGQILTLHDDAPFVGTDDFAEHVPRATRDPAAARSRNAA